MSCFIVGKQTIDDTMTLLVQQGHVSASLATMLGSQIWHVNIDAFAERYSHNTEALAELPEAIAEAEAVIDDLVCPL